MTTEKGQTGPVGSRAGSPIRVQLSRRKGWRKPPNCIVVARPTRYGNPHRVGFCAVCGVEHTQAEAVAEFAAEVSQLPRETLEVFRGKNLACWCPLNLPCNADVLLALANTIPDSCRP